MMLEFYEVINGGDKRRKEEVIRKYFQCWMDKDIDAVKEIFSDDIIYSECYGSVYKGSGQIIRWLGRNGF